MRLPRPAERPHSFIVPVPPEHPSRSAPLRALLVLSLGGTALARAAGGQSLLERSPNLTGDWVGAPGSLHFNFLHRFVTGDAPQRKVSSSPTFLVAAGLPGRTLLGFNYATNSDVAAGYPNEWEFFARYAPLAQERGRAVDVAVQGGYNIAARSVDGELSLGRRIGRVRVRGAVRALSDAYDLGGGRVAFAGGGVLRLARYLAVAGDYSVMPNRPAGYENAWSAGLQLAIPYSPHTLSLQVTNASTATLQGVSAARGSQRRYGFEFTIPITLRRYVPRRAPPAVATESGRAAPPPATTAAAASVAAGMRALTFSPARIEIAAGATVAWTNQDPVAHTVTGDDGSWDSGVVAPGATWRRRFDRPGTYSFHCTPHPFMKGVVVVR